MTHHQQPDNTTIERNCQVCRRTPVTVDGRGTDQTCATCVGNTRTHIKNLGVMATALLGEAIRLNLNSNAAALAGPTADPETWGYRRASAIANRIDPRWLDDQVDMHHPAWILGTWEREARIHLKQILSPGTAQPTLTQARNYLDQHLSHLAQAPDFAFDELATDIRQCHDHVERVLHLEEHIDRGAPCPACGQADLRKNYGTAEDDDRWTCPRCHQWWTETDYRAKIAGVYVGIAPALTASQIRETYRVPEGSTRGWATRGRVTKRGRDHHGRQLYDVAEVLACRDTQATA